MILSANLSIPKTWKWLVLAGCALTGLLFYLQPQAFFTNSPIAIPLGLKSTVQGDEFGDALFKILQDTYPKTKPLTHDGNAEVVGFDSVTPETPRADLVRMSDTDVNSMSDSLRAFRDKIKGKRLPFEARSRGIVSTVAPTSMATFVISLRMLRRTGCTLPLELFLRTNKDEDPNGYLCKTLLPSLNARCVFFDRHVGSHAEKLDKYQFKIFAIIFSTFEELLLLDADSFPIIDPTPLFSADPFVSKGMVTWPDFWANSASPHFFTITSIKPTPLTERLSSEAGQMLLSKRTHSSALLIAAYYNYAGPNYYYELLTQGGPGEGDKETFLAGAETASRPFYSVRTPPGKLGFIEEGQYKGVAITQHDPIEDYTIHSKYPAAAAAIAGISSSSNTNDNKDKQQPRAYFIHANFPKMDPVSLFDPKTMNHMDGKFHRMWTPGNDTIEVVVGGSRRDDVERDLWEEMRFVACEAGDKFRHWKAMPKTTFSMGSCTTVEMYIDRVFGDGKKSAD